MKKSSKLLALAAVLGLSAAATLVPSSAWADHQVCRDRLQFCLAGCTSWSPASCRTNCYSGYNSCEALFQPYQPPSTGGGGNN